MNQKYRFINLLELITFVITFSCSGVYSELEIMAWADTIIATVDVGDTPSVLEYNPSNNDIYVANSGSNEVSVIDSSDYTVVATVPRW